MHSERRAAAFGTIRYNSQTFSIRTARDPAVDVLTLCSMCGAVIGSGIAGGVEAAAGVALLAAWLRPARVQDRVRELRFGGDDAHTWSVVGDGCGLALVEPPVVHVSHRAIVVLEVFLTGKSEFLVFTSRATAPEELRRLRSLLRSRRLTR